MSHTHIRDLTFQTTRRLALALGLTAVFVVVEVAAGAFANSLALLTDAVHNFTDLLALALTWGALRLTSQPANPGKTYGYHRAGILAALVNATVLGAIALGIFYEAYRRFTHPPAINANILIGVGSSGIAINLVTALLLRRGSEKDLNLRSTFLHLMGDVVSALGAVAAGIVIHFTGLTWFDPLVGVFISLIILWNVWGIVREALNILMESTPQDIDMDAMLSDIRAVEGVRGVHDLHVWSITRGLRTLSAHLVTDDVPISQGTAIQAAVSELLRQTYGIGHATLQLECEDCIPADLYCDITIESHAHKG